MTRRTGRDRLVDRVSARVRDAADAAGVTTETYADALLDRVERSRWTARYLLAFALAMLAVGFLWGRFG